MAGERTNGHVRWTQPGSRELTAGGAPGGEAVLGALVTERPNAASAAGDGRVLRRPCSWAPCPYSHRRRRRYPQYFHPSTRKRRDNRYQAPFFPQSDRTGRTTIETVGGRTAPKARGARATW